MIKQKINETIQDEDFCFRFVLGLLSLIFTWQQLSNSVLFLENSFFTSLDFKSSQSTQTYFSIYAFLESPLWFYFLTTVQVALAFLLILNVLPKTSAVFIWILMASAAFINPFLIYGADIVFLLLVMAYPCWRSSNLFLKTQLWAIYFFSGVLKFQSEEWIAGFGLSKSLMIQSITTQWADLLLNFEGLLVGLNYTVMIFEVLIPFVIFLPSKFHTFRKITVGIFIIFHLVIALFFAIPMFSVVMICWWLVVFTNHRDSEPRKASVVWKSLGVTFTILLLITNLSSVTQSKSLVKLSSQLSPLTKPLLLHQKWHLFSIIHTGSDGYFLLEDRLGARRPFPNPQFDPKKDPIGTLYPNNRWRSAMFSILKDWRGHRNMAHGVSRWVCHLSSPTFSPVRLIYVEDSKESLVYDVSCKF